MPKKRRRDPRLTKIEIEVAKAFLDAKSAEDGLFKAWAKYQGARAGYDKARSNLIQALRQR